MAMRAELSSAVLASQDILILDFTEVKWIDDVGLGVLAGVRKLALDKDVELRSTNCSASVSYAIRGQAALRFLLRHVNVESLDPSGPTESDLAT
jgi:anti-anti-sigma regulatory factor